MKKMLILFFALATLFSCSNDSDDTSNEVNIRLSNVSQFDFQNIIVNTSTGNVNFENINAGQNTDYKVFQKAYRYGFVELEIDGQTYILQPIDYVGEIPLDSGYYTYQIDANSSQEEYGKLSLILIED